MASAAEVGLRVGFICFWLVLANALVHRDNPVQNSHLYACLALWPCCVQAVAVVQLVFCLCSRRS